MIAAPTQSRTARASLVHLLRPTIRLRAALTFAALFLVAGTGLLALNYVVLDHSLSTGHPSVAVPSYPASQIIRQAEAVIRSPLSPPLDKAAARGQLALALSHPHARLSGGLLPQVGSEQAAQAAQARAFGDALSQLLRQSAMILAPLALLAIALGWLVAARILGPIRRVTQAARHLSAARLHQRLQPARAQRRTERARRHLRRHAGPAGGCLRISAPVRRQRLPRTAHPADHHAH